MGSLLTMPVIHELFTQHRMECKARDVGRYCEEMVQEFYTFYVATLRSLLERRAALAKHTLLEYIRFRGKLVEIS